MGSLLINYLGPFLWGEWDISRAGTVLRAPSMIYSASTVYNTTNIRKG